MIQQVSKPSFCVWYREGNTKLVCLPNYLHCALVPATANRLKMKKKQLNMAIANATFGRFWNTATKIKTKSSMSLIVLKFPFPSLHR